MTGRGWPTALVAASLAATAFAMAGCAGAEPAGQLTTATAEVTPDAYVALIDTWLDNARANGASEEQLAQLGAWRTDRTTPYADVERALARVFECFDLAGIPYEYVPQAAGVEYPDIAFVAGQHPDLSQAESLAISDACAAKELDFMAIVYRMANELRVAGAE